MIEFDVAGPIRARIGIIGLCFGGRLLAGNVRAVDVHVAKANLAILAVGIAAAADWRAIIRHFHKMQRRDAGPQTERVFDRAANQIVR